MACRGSLLYCNSTKVGWSDYWKRNKIGWGIRLWFKQIALKNKRFAQKKLYFLFVFDSFSLCFPFLCPKANCFHLSLLSCSFLKSDRSYSLLLLLTKEQLWANRSRRILQKSNHERFTPIAHDNRAEGAIHAFSRTNRSFALLLFHSQKMSNLLKKPTSQFPTLYFLYVIDSLSLLFPYVYSQEQIPSVAYRSVALF